MTGPLLDITKDGEAAELILGKPPRLVRFSLYLVAILIVAAVVWAYFTTIDIVISAPGVVRPKGDVLKIQSVISGQLLEVRVKEGDSVKEGAVLFRIDGKDAQSELDKALARREFNLKQIDSLRKSYESLGLQQKGEAEQDLLDIQASEGKLEKAKRALNQSQIAYREFEAKLDSAKKEYDRSKRLADRGDISRYELEKKELDLRIAEIAVESAKGALDIGQQEVSIAERDLSSRNKQIEITKEERKRRLSDLGDRIIAIEEENKTLSFEEGKLRNALAHVEVKSPVAGTVTAIGSKNAAEFIQTGSTLATIAPDGVPWVVEALVPNRDAGPLKKKIGGRVKMKFDAFPFRDYGTLSGKLAEVSSDATAQEKLGMVYKVQVSLDSLTLHRGRKEGQLQLGMSATVEIVKEEERVLLLLFREMRDRVDWE